MKKMAFYIPSALKVDLLVFAHCLLSFFSFVLFLAPLLFLPLLPRVLFRSFSSYFPGPPPFKGFSENDHGAQAVCLHLGFSSGIAVDTYTTEVKSWPIGKCNEGEELMNCRGGYNRGSLGYPGCLAGDLGAIVECANEENVIDEVWEQCSLVTGVVPAASLDNSAACTDAGRVIFGFSCNSSAVLLRWPFLVVLFHSFLATQLFSPSLTTNLLFSTTAL